MNSPNNEKPLIMNVFNILPENLQIMKKIGCPDAFVIRKLKCTSIHYFTYLHQFHDWDWVEEMKPTKLVSPASNSSNLSDGERGGVAGKYRGTENERKREKYSKRSFNSAAVFYVKQFITFHHFIVCMCQGVTPRHQKTEKREKKETRNKNNKIWMRK